MGRFALRVETLETRELLSGPSAWRPWGPAWRPATAPRAAEYSSDRLAAPTLTAALDAASDPLGDGHVYQARVVVVGQTTPGAVVRASSGASARPVVAGADGTFRITLQLAEGADGVTLQARDRWGRVATTVVDATRGNAVVAWNAAALEAIRRTSVSPPVASRALAIVHAAVYDAVNAITPVGPSYLVDARAPRGASAEAAAVAAAHASLTALFPTQAALFDAAYGQAVAGLGRGRGVALGLEFGAMVAGRLLQARADDGSTSSVAYTPGTDPGDWRPTLPAFAPALLPQWPGVTPFAMPTADAFRPAPPPDLAGADYAAAWQEVKDLGSADSTSRTADQTEIARFWADGAGTATPPGHWNVIAEGVSRARREPLARAARTFAMLNIGLADAAIACWDAKYAYDLWRPITAIREADTDGNPATVADPSWSPLIATPPFPTYTSGHSTFSAAAATILTALYGGDVRFQTSSDGLPGVTRSFRSFEAAAAEAAVSRLYGGIHFTFDNDEGLVCGRQIGDHVLAMFGRRRIP